MATLAKNLDLLLREISDPYAQENFWRLRQIINDILQQGGAVGPQGPSGPVGPAGTTPTTVPKVSTVFNTDVGTVPGNLVKVNGANSVTKVTDNLPATIPNGVFGIGLAKPSSLQIEVLFIGIISGYAGLTAGLPLFISATGTPTHTPPPLGTPAILQQIGFAISNTDLFVQMYQPMRRA